MKSLILVISLFFFSFFQAHAADFFWVGGSGDWTDINHWATTSGGVVKHITVPSPSDNVIFDASSFSATGQTVVINAFIATCKDFIIQNNIANKPVFTGNNTLQVFGSMQLSDEVDWLYSGKVYFEATTAGHTITTNSVRYRNDVYFEGIGGSWLLMDSLFVNNNNIYLLHGSLHTNGNYIRCRYFYATATNQRTLNLSTSLLELRSWNIATQNLTISAGQARFLFKEGGSFTTTGSQHVIYNDVHFQGDITSVLSNADATFNTVRFDTSGDISGVNNFDSLILSPGSAYEFFSATSAISTALMANANCNAWIVIEGSWNLTMPASALFSVNGAHIEGVTATGGNAFVATESYDHGNNTGLQIIAPLPQNLYWVGGKGYWNDPAHWSYSSGGTGGACIPTPVDDVIFDQNSFSVSDTLFIDDEAYCHDMLWTNLNDTVIFLKTDVLNIYGSITLHNMITWDGAYTSTYFLSDTPGETITTDGVILKGPFIFDGDASWYLQDDFYLDSNVIHHKKGDIYTNGNDVTCYNYVSDYTTNRALILSSSVMTIETAGMTGWRLNGNNFSFSAGTSTIRFINPDVTMHNTSTSGFTFNIVVFESDEGTAELLNDYNIFNHLTFASNGFIDGNNTIGVLTFSKGKAYELVNNMNQVVLQDFVALGDCDGHIMITSNDPDYNTTITKNGGAINCNYLILRNITAGGTALFTATNSVDLGNNYNWNIISPAGEHRYWVGGTGNWSDISHWSYTSGGAGGACVPSPLDTVHFDGNSFLKTGDTVLIDLSNATCNTMLWYDTLQQAELHGSDLNDLRIWGSLQFDTAMTNCFLGDVYFEANQTGNTILSAGNRFLDDVFFQGKGGEWTFLDSLYVFGAFYFHYGSIVADHVKMEAGTFVAVKIRQRSFDMQYAEFVIHGSGRPWMVFHDTLTMLTYGSHLVFTSPSVINEKFDSCSYAVNVDFYDMTFEHPAGRAILKSGNCDVSYRNATFNNNAWFKSSFHYDTLYLNKGKRYQFTHGTVQAFNHLYADGTCFEPIVFEPAGTGTAYSLHQPAGNVNVQYVEMKGCTGMPGAQYFAYSSADNGNNNNWTFTPVGPADLYWVNGTGVWTDPYHWSYSSGGPPGACLPTWRDNVFFDQNSFLTPNDTVLIDIYTAECHDMQWINISSNPVFNYSLGFSVYGSLRLDTAIRPMGYNEPVRFLSNDPGEYIYWGKLPFGEVIFDGNGGWTLHDSLFAYGYLRLEKGFLNTNGQYCKAGSFRSFNTNNRTLTLGNSHIDLVGYWSIKSDNMALNAGTSKITFSQYGTFRTEGANAVDYHTVLINGMLGNSNISVNGNTPVSYKKMMIATHATISGEHVFDTLIFMPGNQYKLAYNTTQTINDEWVVRGNNCFPITLQSTLLGHQANVLMSNGVVSGDFIHIRDINAFGGATFYAGDNSTDVANNTGWTFNNSPSYIFGLGPDIMFTIGNTITLSTANFNPGPGTTYLWSDGSTGPTLVVTQPGTYSVTVTYAGGCYVMDTIRVFCNVQPSYTISDCICFGDSTGAISMTIMDTVGVYTAVWDFGDTGLVVSNLPSGYYVVQITGTTGCDGEDTLFVGQPPQLHAAQGDTSFCEDQPGMWLDAGTGFVNFWWDGVPGQQLHWVSQKDTVVIVVEDNKGCRSPGDTVEVAVDTIPVIDMGETQEICKGETVELSPGYGFDDYLWHNGSTNPVFVATDAGMYWVTVRNKTCLNTDTVLLVDCPPMISFPNVFTPNADGYNDYFYPEQQNMDHYTLIVYNRWGTVVFQTHDPWEQWDGRCNEKPCPDGTYYYTVVYEGYGAKAVKGRKILNGVVTILR